MKSLRNEKLIIGIEAILICLLLSTTLSAATLVGNNDRVGWSCDGNQDDPDDWGATALALSIFAKMGWQDKLVHFDYQNRLDAITDWKAAEETNSALGGCERFMFDRSVFFDDHLQRQAAINNATAEINKSHAGSKFWYAQAGSFEVAYRALLAADPAKRQYCVLVSHSHANEEWRGPANYHNKDDCVALGASFFSTTDQDGSNPGFGNRQLLDWSILEWMENSLCPEYRWVWSRMRKTSEHIGGGIDASDGGMAYCLATGDVDGNFNPKLKNFLGTSWPKPDDR
jgi:hypothetical protein